MSTRLLAACAAALCLVQIATASAQRTAGLYNGQVPTAAQWNALFIGKVDTTGGAMASGSVSNSTLSSDTLMSPTVSQSTPASASAPCSVGQLSIDSQYIYSCVSANNWLSAPLIAYQTGVLTAAGPTSTVGYRQNGQILITGGVLSTVLTQPGGALFAGANAGSAYNLTTNDSYGPVGIGVGSLQNLTAIVSEDACLGTWSCQYITTAAAVTGIGMHALGAETTHNGDTALGNDAMRDAIGYSTTGTYVTAIGASAVQNGNPDNGVVGVGATAMRGTSASIALTGTKTTGNTVTIGITSSVSGLTGLPLNYTYTVQAGDTMSSIAANIATALNASVTGPSYSIQASNLQISDGTQEIYLFFPGSQANGWTLNITASGTGTITATAQPGSHVSLSVAVGQSAMNGGPMTTVSNDVAVGAYSLSNLTTGSAIIAIGAYAGAGTTSGGQDVFVGDSAGQSCLTCTDVVAIGYQAMKNGTTASTSVAVGRQALLAITSATNDLALGDSSEYSMTTGSFNAGLGPSTLFVCTTCSNNVAAGYGALYNNNANDNVAIGMQSMQSATGNDNVAVGWRSGYSLTSGTYNTILGDGAGTYTLTTGNGNILIGNGADTVAGGTNHEINIGGLLFYNITSTSAPTVSGGTGPTIDSHANNRSGTVTVGTGTVTSATITFAGGGYTTWNHCRLSPHGTYAALSYTVSLTAISISATSLTSDVFDYDCDGF